MPQQHFAFQNAQGLCHSNIWFPKVNRAYATATFGFLKCTGLMPQQQPAFQNSRNIQKTAGTLIFPFLEKATQKLKKATQKLVFLREVNLLNPGARQASQPASCWTTFRNDFGPELILRSETGEGIEVKKTRFPDLVNPEPSKPASQPVVGPVFEMILDQN